jgi:zona occludens toxin (predicted ATPase)
MKKRSVSPIGALHPILFFAGVYVVVLFFSIFICSSLFYSFNTTSGGNYSSDEKKVSEPQTATVAIASVK